MSKPPCDFVMFRCSPHLHIIHIFLRFFKIQNNGNIQGFSLVSSTYTQINNQKKRGFSEVSLRLLHLLDIFRLF